MVTPQAKGTQMDTMVISIWDGCASQVQTGHVSHLVTPTQTHFGDGMEMINCLLCESGESDIILRMLTCCVVG